MIKPEKNNELTLSIMLTALTSMGVLSVTLYVPSMLAIAEGFQVNKSEVQITLSLFLLGFAGGQLIYGPLSDQFGRRPILLIGLILYAIAGVFCALAQDIEAMQIARLAQGIGACCGAVIARAVVRDVFPPEKAIKAFAFIATALSLTPALAPIVGGQLQEYFGWRSGFWFLALVGFTMFFWVAFRLKESNQNLLSGAINPKRLVKIYWDVGTNLRFLSLVLIGSLLFCGLMSYTTISPFLMLEELQLTPVHYSLLIMFTAASYGVGSFLSGRLVAKIGPKPLMILGPVISINAACLMLYLSDELTILALVVPVSMFVLGNGLVVPPTMAAALKPFPRVAGSASAMIGAIQMGSAGITSVLVHHSYDGTAQPLALIMLGLAVGSLLCCLSIHLSDRRETVITPVG